MRHRASGKSRGGRCRVASVLRRAWMVLNRNQTVIAAVSLVWLLWRSGTQPRRLAYPCQRAAAANLTGLALAVLPTAVLGHRACSYGRRLGRRAVVLGQVLFVASTVFLLGWAGYEGYLYAADLLEEKVSAARPQPASSSGEGAASPTLSSRLLAPSEDEAIVAYGRDMGAAYGSYPWGPENGNTVYALVKRTVLELHLGTESNPLRDLISPGDKVVIKPNLVHNNNVGTTRVAVLRPLVDMAAAAGASQIIIGDGTADGGYATFDTVGITQTWINYLRNLYPASDVQRIEFNDPAHYYWVTMGTGAGGASTYVGSGYTDNTMVRKHLAETNDYFGTPASPRTDSRGATNTGNVMGWYAFSSYLLDADVVINVPKIKSHGWAINTAAVKNWVGATLKRTNALEYHWLRIDHHIYNATSYQMAFGSDTMWRDVGDLQRAQLYWKAGVVHSTPQRKYLVVIDGIHGVERSVVDPSPSDMVHLGAIVASVDPVAADCVASRLMGYDWRPKFSGGQWRGGVPVINNQPGASPGHPLGTNDVSKIRVIGEAIGPSPNYVFKFDYANDPSGSWPDWSLTRMSDFTPPSITSASLVPQAGQMALTATVQGAIAVYAYYGDDGNGAPHVIRMTQQGTTDTWTCMLPAGSMDAIIRAQDANLNVSRVAAAYRAPGDFDGDADVDLGDFSYFQACFNGPNRSYALAECGNADFDRDADTDLSDFAVFQGCFNGPNRPPACE